MKSVNLSINDPILKTKTKKKTILVISSDDISRQVLMGRLTDYYQITNRRKTVKDEINIAYQIENKKFELKLKDSTGYELNTHNLNVTELSKCDGIIFIFTKYSYDSLKYISDYIKTYHSVIGNKFFPCIFVQNETIYSTTNYSTTVTKKEISEITMKGCFPIVKVKRDFDKKESNKILKKILTEIKKEKNDDFPYSLVYREELKINFCIKNRKVFSIVNIFMFLLIMVFTLLDTIFIINTQDFENETKKVDDIFLGIRLNINAINFLSATVFTKYAICDREKYTKIRRLERYVIIVNVISLCVQMLLHLRVKHVSISNNNI